VPRRVQQELRAAPPARPRFVQIIVLDGGNNWTTTPFVRSVITSPVTPPEAM
jgi:hypothetical protein